MASLTHTYTSRWQNALVTTQHQITDQKTKYLEKREEMFQKVSVRVESRLLAFVDDIKFMQKTVKKEMGESNSTERGILTTRIDWLCQ